MQEGYHLAELVKCHVACHTHHNSIGILIGMKLPQAAGMGAAFSFDLQ